MSTDILKINYSGLDLSGETFVRVWFLLIYHDSDKCIFGLQLKMFSAALVEICVKRTVFLGLHPLDFAF